MAEIVVVGQVARDLVLRVDGIPAAGGSAAVRRRRELLGGKGANQAVGMAQLGASVALVGVVGDDAPGDGVLAQARRDGIDVTAVRRRAGARTALLVDLVTGGGRRRLFEDVPAEVLLTPPDVAAAGELVASARTVVLQLQQPAEAVAVAARAGRAAGCTVVMDGAVEDAGWRDRLLACADVLRADAREAALLAGYRLDGPDATVAAARGLLDRGPRLVALSAGRAGNVVAWPGGHAVIPLFDVPTEDPTGAGDAFVAALAVSLLRGAAAVDAGWQAAAAAASTVGRPGGRPDLSPGAVDDLARRHRHP